MRIGWALALAVVASVGGVVVGMRSGGAVTTAATPAPEEPARAPAAPQYAEEGTVAPGSRAAQAGAH